MQLIKSSEGLTTWQRTQTNKGHRTLCCLCGSEKESLAWTDKFLTEAPKNQVLHGPQPTAKDHLGHSFTYIIFNAWHGFHPDHFCSMIDCLEGGGLCFLLVPTEINEWLNSRDPEFEKFAQYSDQFPKHRFLRRLITWLHNSNENICFVSADAKPINPNCTAGHISTSLKTLTPKTPTRAQALFLTAALAHLNHNRFALSLVANRGRGKSYALGLFIGKAFQSHPQRGLHWALCTPKKNQATAILALAAEILDVKPSNQGIYYQNCTIEWCALDQLCQASAPEFDLLIIDESAGFPLQGLQEIIQKYDRIIFSTTVIGYEGSGQGFLLKFSEILKLTYSIYIEYQLTEPLRWQSSDPIEKWLNQVFLFDDAAYAKVTNETDRPIQNNLTAFSIEKINLDDLPTQEARLSKIYGLLKTAHYRTRPSDLRLLLDAPGQHLWACWMKDQCIGVVWACQDGPLPEHLHQDILKGKRRLKGHLIPQLLAFKLGITQYLNAKILRIIRIAVDPNLRRQGVGSQLINSAQSFASSQNWDALGTTFSNQSNTLTFWESLGFNQIYVGAKKQASSGQTSITLIKTL